MYAGANMEHPSREAGLRCDEAATIIQNKSNRATVSNREIDDKQQDSKGTALSY
jgi:hypothetical protein